jgi:hypothetical protein
MAHLFWAVDCKGECGTQILLKYIGPHDPAHMPFLLEMNPDPIVVPCLDCGGSYEYRKDELVARIINGPPDPNFVDQF